MDRRDAFGASAALILLVASGCDGCGDDGASSSGGGSGGSGSEATGPGSGGAGGGDSLVTVGTAGGGGTGQGSGGACNGRLLGKIRDFRVDHPDFEDFLGSDPGIVQGELGPDGKPVYAGLDGNPTTSGQEAFDQWFRDVDGVNQPIPLTITMQPQGDGVWTFDDGDFFPIDGQGFGDEGNPHNFHFTFELRTTFRYRGGEVFRFTGDDDLFTFVNGRLAIDLGGVHGAEEAEIDLDAQAGALGITVGEVYPLDFFFAERHTTQSNFRIDTTIDEFVDCGTIPN